MRFLLLFTVCFLLCTRAIAQVPSYVPSDGLVGWWPFNGNADDESGNGNDGTVYGASITTDRMGVSERAFSFDGTSDFISVAHDNSLNLTNAYTISAWVKLPDHSGGPSSPNAVGAVDLDRTILGKPATAGWTTGYNLSSNPNGETTHLTTAVANMSCCPNTIVFSSASQPLNAWINITSVYNGTSLKLYLNGVLDNEVQQSYTLSNSIQPLLIGKEFVSVDDNWYRWFKGAIDDIGIWNRALSEEEILGLFTGFDLPPSSHSCGASNTHNADVQYGTMTDQEGTPYRTVQIGDQIWMAENLMTSHYSNGDEIPTIPATGNLWHSTLTGASCWLNDDSATYACPYGKLYNWYAAGNSRNVCPTGWHVPSITEFNTLLNHLGPTAGGQMKTQGVQYWTSGNLGGSNTSGFSGLPAGTRWQDTYVEQGILAHFWCSTTDEVGLVNSDLVRLHFNQTNADVFTWDNRRGHSIRCVQDVNTTGIRSNAQHALRVYPNPSHGAFMIELSGLDPATILVFDGVGRQVHSERLQALLPKGNHTLDLTKLSPGVYWLAFERGGARTGQSIVIH